MTALHILTTRPVLQGPPYTTSLNSSCECSTTGSVTAKDSRCWGRGACVREL